MFICFIFILNINLYNIYTVGVSELPKLKEIQEKNYDVKEKCAYRLYDPKHIKSGQPMSEYGTDVDTDVELVAWRTGAPKGTPKRRKGRKRKRVESDSEYEPDPNFNNRKRRKIDKKRPITKKKVCNFQNVTFYICLFFFVYVMDDNNNIYIFRMKVNQNIPVMMK